MSKKKKKKHSIKLTDKDIEQLIKIRSQAKSIRRKLKRLQRLVEKSQRIVEDCKSSIDIKRTTI